MKKALIIILSIISVLTLSITSVYVSISRALETKNIKSNISNNLLTGLIYDENGNKTEIFKTVLLLTTLDEDTVVKLINNEKANKILTDLINSVYDYNLTGDSKYKYTPQQIISLVKNNLDEVTAEINYNLDASDKKEIINYVENHINYIIDTIYKIDLGDYRP